jgi:hypothetical protein
LSAYNLVIFAGVFVVQWGIGLLVDAFQAAGPGRSGRHSAPHSRCSWPAEHAVVCLVPLGQKP